MTVQSGVEDPVESGRDEGEEVGVVEEGGEVRVDTEADEEREDVEDLRDPERNLAREVEEGGGHGVDGDAAEWDAGLQHGSGNGSSRFSESLFQLTFSAVSVSTRSLHKSR